MPATRFIQCCDSCTTDPTSPTDAPRNANTSVNPPTNNAACTSTPRCRRVAGGRAASISPISVCIIPPVCCPISAYMILGSGTPRM